MGTLSKDKAELILSKEEAGAYLVRGSTTFPDHPYTLSVSTPAGSPIKHVRIKRVVKMDNTLRFSIIFTDKRTVKEYDTLRKLIEAEEVKKDFGLKKVCAPPAAGPFY